MANKAAKTFVNGLVYENPTFRLVLGMCPTLAVTTSATNGLGMGLAATFVGQQAVHGVGLQPSVAQR